MGKLPISLCMFVKNEEMSVRDCIESVIGVVSEIVIVDTGSTDKTIELCKKYTDRIYSIGFVDFGSLRTITAHLSNRPWVLMLDADERISGDDWGKFSKLVDHPEGVAGDDMELDENGKVVVDSFALPRKRWADTYMTKQVELEAYPDWQVRLFRNHINRPKVRFIRRVHETISGCIKTEQCPDGPTIHHFQNVNKSPAELAARTALYKKLYAEDISEGIAHDEPAIAKIDED